MPLIIPKTLPAYDALYEENVFVMHRERALSQHIRPLEILILNLMPTKIATETQIARLLANTPIQVHMTLLQTASHAATHVSAAHLEAFYKTFDEVKNNRYDGMIITGAPVEKIDFEQVDYWQELCEIMDFSETNVYSTLHVCWGAQAGLYYHYGIRKQLLEFDDVQNDQRREIYGLRNDILESTDCSELVKNLREGYFTDLFRAYVPPETVEEQWDLDALTSKVEGVLGTRVDFKQMLEASDTAGDEELLEALLKKAEELYAAKENLVGKEGFTSFARSVLLQVIDQLWRQHIAALDALRQGIYLRGYAQKQPKQEYKREAFAMFEELLDRIRETLINVVYHVEIRLPEEAQEATEAGMQSAQQRVDDAQASQAPAGASALDEMAREEAEDRARFAHVGRNDPCPCGSGKRFKDCHGKLH